MRKRTDNDVAMEIAIRMGNMLYPQNYWNAMNETLKIYADLTGDNSMIRKHRKWWQFWKYLTP